MDLNLSGKVVGITGGATGIGRACALQYLKEGCKVAVCGRTKEKLDRFAAECAELGYADALLCHVADVADPCELTAFVTAIVGRFGALDIWYNNAGIGIRKPFLELSLDEWDQVMDINLRATFVGSKLAAQHMVSQGGGVIINASSFTSCMPVAGHGPYSVSKWGINGFTRVLAAELAVHNIRVFAFIPGMIETDITRDRMAVHRKTFAEQAALNRVGVPEDLAPTLVMLSSDLASYFTGGCVEISGGKFCVQNPNFSWS